MNLEKTRVDLLSIDYFKMIKDPQSRGVFFDLFTEIGEDICKKCPSQWFPAYQRLKHYSFINIKPMSERKWNFKKGASIRVRDKKEGTKVYNNSNISDKVAEELMEKEEEYKKFFEINTKYAVQRVVEEDDTDKEEKTKLKAEIEELTGEKPKGNPGIETLKTKLEEAKKAKA